MKIISKRKSKKEDNLKNEDDIENEDDIKNEDNLKIEDDLKNENHLKNQDDLENKDNFMYMTILGPSLHNLSYACFSNTLPYADYQCHTSTIINCCF